MRLSDKHARRTRSSGSRVPFATVAVSTWLLPGWSCVFEWSQRYTFRQSQMSCVFDVAMTASQLNRPMATPETMAKKSCSFNLPSPLSQQRSDGLA